MAKCFSLTATRDWCYRYSFSNAGLRSTVKDLGDGTVMHCWVPKTRKETKPHLVLLHGFGANAMWQWGDMVRLLATHFNVYVPDLVFFGGSYTTRPERSDWFQAGCVMRVMEANKVGKMRVVGLSYGGFVAYCMAARWPEAVQRVVMCGAGVGFEEKDLAEGMFPVADLEEAAAILLPQTPEKMRELMRYAFFKPHKAVPSCLLRDFIDVMCKEHIEEKRDLIRAIPKDRKLSDLPKITQPTLIIWGDHDQIFPLELAHRLRRHLGANSELVVVKNTGHAFIAEKPKEVLRHLKSFLIDSAPSTSSLPDHHKPQPQPQLITD